MRLIKRFRAADLRGMSIIIPIVYMKLLCQSKFANLSHKNTAGYNQSLYFQGVLAVSLLGLWCSHADRFTGE
jgi:hypothetical protein